MAIQLFGTNTPAPEGYVYATTARARRSRERLGPSPRRVHFLKAGRASSFKAQCGTTGVAVDMLRAFDYLCPKCQKLWDHGN